MGRRLSPNLSWNRGVKMFILAPAPASDQNRSGGCCLAAKIANISFRKELRPHSQTGLLSELLLARWSHIGDTAATLIQIIEFACAVRHDLLAGGGSWRVSQWAKMIWLILYAGQMRSFNERMNVLTPQSRTFIAGSPRTMRMR